jgi:hypothetical protein
MLYVQTEWYILKNNMHSVLSKFEAATSYKKYLFNGESSIQLQILWK